MERFKKLCTEALDSYIAHYPECMDSFKGSMKPTAMQKLNLVDAHSHNVDGTDQIFGDITSFFPVSGRVKGTYFEIGSEIGTFQVVRKVLSMPKNPSFYSDKVSRSTNIQERINTLSLRVGISGYKKVKTAEKTTLTTEEVEKYKEIYRGTSTVQRDFALNNLRLLEDFEDFIKRQANA